MTAEPFRSAWLGVWPLGLIDAVLHVAAAVWLPGPWWLQYLPDLALPLLWTRSMLTNRRAGDHSLLLKLHRLLHARPPLLGEGVCLWAGLAFLWFPQLALHAAVHVVVDRLTHDRRWQ